MQEQGVSIIIPTRNEEKYLPILLESIKKQTQPPSEIIVADADSDDKTREIAKSYGCKIVNGGKHPGIGRNNGAKVANGQILIFFDADVILPEDFLEKALSEFEVRKLDVACCFARPNSKKWVDHIGAFLNNAYYFLTERILMNGVGFCMFARRQIHEKIGGFDETILIAEDQDYAVRASKIGKYRFLRSIKINVSMRRFEKEGRLIMTLRYLQIYIFTTFFGKIRKPIVSYKFGNYNEKNDKNKES